MNLGYAIPREIRIIPSANKGFLIRIGACGKFVAASSGSLLLQLEEYLQDPVKWEREYAKLSRETEDRPAPRKGLAGRALVESMELAEAAEEEE